MSFAPVVLSAAALAAGVAASAPRATTTTKYHLNAKIDNTVDLSVFGAPSQVTNLALDAWIVMALSDSAGGKVVHVVVDSVKVETNMPQIQTGDGAAAKGATIHGFLDPAGRMKNLTSNLPTNTLVNSVQGAVNGMFPRVRAGAKPGDSWVDTTDVNNAGEGNHTTAKVVTTYNAAAAERVGGIAGVRGAAPRGWGSPTATWRRSRNHGLASLRSIVALAPPAARPR
jgi:hypothetical protein